MKIIKLLFVFLVSNAAVLAQNYDSTNLTEVVGCYEVVMPETFDKVHMPPSLIELTADTHYANQDNVRYKVKSISENHETMDGITWRWEGKDSFIISWSTGFQGFILDLTVIKTFPMGLAKRTSDLDIESVYNYTVVHLEKIKCDH